ncbi:MAG: glycosyltransferase family 9 protein [Planctomycetota bacterium]
MSPEPSSILLVLPTWVGDLVMATPMLRAIRSRFAEARITFLLNPNLRDLVAGGDWMDECIEWPGENAKTQKRRNAETDAVPQSFLTLMKCLRRRRFDLAVLLPNSFRAALIARLSGAKRRIGYDRDGRGFLLTDRVPVRNRRGGRWSAQRTLPPSPFVPSSRSLPWKGPFVPSVRMGTKLPVRLGRYVPMPLVEYYADLAEAVGCERPGDRLELFTTTDGEKSVQRRLESLGIADRHPLIVISPGAKFGASKCWPPERFAAVADRLIESNDAAVIVTCGPGEESIARAIGAAMKNHRISLKSPLTLPSPPKRGRGVWDRPSPQPSPSKGEGATGFVFDSPRNGPPNRTPSASAGPAFPGRETQGRSLALPVPSQALSLGELKSLVRRSDLLICNDAGPRHIAKAFDVPVVTVFGPTHPDWTSTSYGDERIVRIDVDCGPCQQRVCPLGHHQCMTGVSVDMVFAAAVALLHLRAPEHARAR